MLNYIKTLGRIFRNEKKYFKTERAIALARCNLVTLSLETNQLQDFVDSES